MEVILLDTNIYDLLADDRSVINLINSLINSSQIEIVVPQVVKDELINSPFNGVPNLFATKLVPDGVAVIGVTKIDAALIGNGVTYSNHLGVSSKAKDAVIADTANNHSDIFVSEDDRCLHRLVKISDCQCFNYEDFKTWLEEQDNQ